MATQPYWDASLGRYVDPVTEGVRTDVAQRASGYTYTPLPKQSIAQNPVQQPSMQFPQSPTTNTSPFVGGSMPSTFRNPTATTIQQTNQNPGSVTRNVTPTIGNTGYNASGTQPSGAFSGAAGVGAAPATGGQPATGGFSNIGSPTDPAFWDPTRQPSYGTLPPGVSAPLMTDVQKGYNGQPTRLNPWATDPATKYSTPTSDSDFMVRNQILASVNKDLGYASYTPTFELHNQSNNVRANNVKAWDMYSQRMQAAGLGNMVGPEPAAIAAARIDPAVMANPNYPQPGTQYGAAPTTGGGGYQPGTGGGASTNQYPSGAAPMGPPGYGNPQPNTGSPGPYSPTGATLPANFPTGQGGISTTPNVGAFFGQMAQSYPQLGGALAQLLGPLAPYVDAATSGMTAAFNQQKANQDIELQSRFANQGSYLSSPMFAGQGQLDANLTAQYLKDLGGMQTDAANNQANRSTQTANNLAQMFTTMSQQAMQSGSMLQAAQWQTMADMFKTQTGADTSRYATDVGAQTSMYNTNVGAASNQYNTDADTYKAQLQYSLGQAGLGVQQTGQVLQFLDSAQARQLQGQGITFDQLLKLAITQAGGDQSILDKLYAAAQAPGTAGLNLFQLLSGIPNVQSATTSGLGQGLLGLAGGLGLQGSNIFSSILGSLMGGGAAAGGAGTAGSLLGGALAFL